MDANTASVIISIVTLVVSPLILFFIQRSNAKQIKAVSTQVYTVEKKLDDNHKLNNGNLTKLLETTEKLATAQEKAKHEGEGKDTDKKLKVPGK